jgi:hypothetical protein
MIAHTQAPKTISIKAHSSNSMKRYLNLEDISISKGSQLTIRLKAHPGSFA